MKKVAVIGAGVSGLACAQLLKDRFAVRVFEKERLPGGLIACDQIKGSLFHKCGGHVFNTKNSRVADWFWSFFDRDKTFIKTKRHSSVYFDGVGFVDYPIENHVYQLDGEVQKRFIVDMMNIINNPSARPPENFDEFLLGRFGRTLYEMYFLPYNSKVWRRSLKQIPLSWLEGKLPMPTPEEMLISNEKHLEEEEFVHSTFYYPVDGGSQYIADSLSKGLDISYCSNVEKIAVGQGCVKVFCSGGAQEMFDCLIFTGNVKTLNDVLVGINVEDMEPSIKMFEYHGTTSVFCSIDKNPYSWIYQPSARHESHRIICTGNFSEKNNGEGLMTGTIEFTDEIPEGEIRRQLSLMPLHPTYIAHQYNEFTYPIQHATTRTAIQNIKDRLSRFGIYLVGRFAEWEYFNMDAAIASAMRICDKLR